MSCCDFDVRDLRAMTRALQLAEQGLFTTTPNPRVGCVILASDGDLIGEGFHLRAGQAHAEINALQMAGEKSRGALVYVTLEPCNHQGRTGPCSQALIDAGVSEVIYAMEDPNPLVAGQGIARLKAAGIRVRGPFLEAQARSLNIGFIKRMLTGRPYVRCKLAMSLDGRTAMASGQSQWITGSEARRDVQKLRAQSCCIVTGSGTVLADNPALSVRDPILGPNPRQPLRIVLDSQLRTPLNAQILQKPEHTILVSTKAVKSHGEAIVWTLTSTASHTEHGVDLLKLLQKLGKEQHNDVLLEAGPTLAGAFLQAGLIDEIIVYIAAKLMGSLGRPLFDLPIHQMSDCIDLTLSGFSPVGGDWRVIARPSNTIDPLAMSDVTITTE
jgi:diaminohydroxyphosphoribosylaminopyrimidine deaminase/5-amino-6-(5-phosphoribosylamino)uracil reductase